MNKFHTDNTNYLYKDLSYQLVGICMEIHREYKSVHNERIYHKALEEKLSKNKINFLSKPKIAICSKETGKEIGYYEPDLVVDDKIIIELKENRLFLKVTKYNY
jgi:GxxExxY protein